jgi:transcriptional regulator with XRE-family HTH domain
MPRTKFFHWRTARGFTMRDVSAVSGLSISMLSRLETGHRTPSISVKVRLARALGVPVRALFDPAADRAAGPAHAPDGLRERRGARLDALNPASRARCARAPSEALTMREKLTAEVRETLGVVRDTTADLAGLRTEHESGGAESDRLKTQSAVQSDLAATAPGLVAAHVAAVRARVGPDVVAAVPGAITWSMNDGTVARLPAHLPDIVHTLSGFSILALADPDAAVRMLVNFAPATGLTISERLARLAELKRRGEELEAAHARLVDELAAAGLTASHLPVTVSRRRAEQNERERKARLAEEDALEPVEGAINDPHRPQTVRRARRAPPRARAALLPPSEGPLPRGSLQSGPGIRAHWGVVWGRREALKPNPVPTTHVRSIHVASSTGTRHAPLARG